MNPVEVVNNNIRAVRQHRNISQTYIASKLNITQNAYSKMELGRSSMTVERLFIIAALLDSNVRDLLNPNFKVTHFY